MTEYTLLYDPIMRIFVFVHPSGGRYTMNKIPNLSLELNLARMFTRMHYGDLTRETF